MVLAARSGRHEAITWLAARDHVPGAVVARERGQAVRRLEQGHALERQVLAVRDERAGRHVAHLAVLDRRHHARGCREEKRREEQVFLESP